MVLTFSRASTELDSVLMPSGPAHSAIASGVNIKPHWAGGAKIFVQDFGPDSDFPGLDHLLPSNVITHEDDVEDLMETLRDSLPYRIMKRKPHTAGMCSVPQEGSLMAVSSSASQWSASSLEMPLGATGWSEPASDITSDRKMDIEHMVIPVSRTFVHFAIRDQASARKAKPA